MKTNSIIFKTCHELTKKLVSGTKFNYSATFSACLKLYYSNFSEFTLVCSFNDLNIVQLANSLDNQFDFFDVLPFIDNDKKARTKFDNMVKFALAYGLKKRDAFRYKAEIVNDSVSDNYNPVSVDNMRKNDIDDLKQDIILYMLKRENDPDFRNIKNVFQLLRAGDAIVTNYSKKTAKKIKMETSLDFLEEKGFIVADNNDYYNTINIDSLIMDISAKVPKNHRKLAEDIIRLYCLDRKGNIKAKARKQQEIADELNTSIRTIKTVWKEITDLKPSLFR